MKKLALIIALVVVFSCTFAVTAGAASNIYNAALGACDGRGCAAATDGDTETGWTYDCGDIAITLSEEVIVESVEIIQTGDIKLNGFADATGVYVYGKPIEGAKVKSFVLTDYAYYNSNGTTSSTLYEVRVMAKEIVKPNFYNVAIGACEGRGCAAITDGNTETSWTFDCGDIVVDFGAEYILEEPIALNQVAGGNIYVSRWATNDGTWHYVEESPEAGTTVRQIVLTDRGWATGAGDTLNELIVYGRKAIAGPTHNAVKLNPENVLYDGDDTNYKECTKWHTMVIELDAVYNKSDITLEVIGGDAPYIQAMHTSETDSTWRDEGNWVRIVTNANADADVAEVKVIAPVMERKSLIIPYVDEFYDNDPSTTWDAPVDYTTVQLMDGVYNLEDLTLEADGCSSVQLLGLYNAPDVTDKTQLTEDMYGTEGNWVKFAVNVGGSGPVTISDVRVITYVKVEATGGNVLYNANGGTGSQSDDYDYEAGAQVAVKDAGTISKDGHEFLGWSEDDDATEATYVAGDCIEIDGDVTLYAVFEAVETIDVNFTVTGDSGYYAETADGADKVGEVVFNSAIIDFVDYDQITAFGFYIYNSAELGEVKATLTADSLDGLVTENGKFYCSVINFAEADFGKPVVAVPYAVISGEAYAGTATSMTVTVDEGNWLGPVEE